MTFEKIEGHSIDESHLHNVINISDNIIGTINYNNVIKLPKLYYTICKFNFFRGSDFIINIDCCMHSYIFQV